MGDHMTYSHACTRCAQLGGAALLTAALATSLLTLPPGRTSRMPVESHLMLLQAATASAITNSSALDAALPTDSPADLSATGIQANSTAAATTDGSFWSSPIGTALLLADIAVLPIWFLFAPITLPVTMLVAASQTDTSSSFSSLQFLMLTAIGFLTGPMGVASLLMNTSSTPAAAVSRRSAASAANAVSGISSAAGKSEMLPAVQPLQPHAAIQAATTAAATTFGPLGDFVYDLARNVALAVGIALVPLWWVGAPITFPIGLALGEVLFPNDAWGLFPNMGNLLTAIAAPYALVSKLFPDRAYMLSPSAAAVRPASARSRVPGKSAVSPAPVKRAAAAVRSSGKAKAAGAASKRIPSRAVSR